MGFGSQPLKEQSTDCYCSYKEEREMTTSLKTFSLLGKALPPVSLEFTAIFKTKPPVSEAKVSERRAILRYIRTTRLLPKAQACRDSTGDMRYGKWMENRAIPSYIYLGSIG